MDPTEHALLAKASILNPYRNRYRPPKGTLFEFVKAPVLEPISPPQNFPALTPKPYISAFPRLQASVAEGKVKAKNA